MIYGVEVQLGYEAADHSEATRQASELSTILTEAGYEHIGTTVMDQDGELVASFGITKEGE